MGIRGYHSSFPEYLHKQKAGEKYINVYSANCIFFYCLQDKQAAKEDLSASFSMLSCFACFSIPRMGPDALPKRLLS
jgi:hypothetical protein